jgi:hypothetical protein
VNPPPLSEPPPPAPEETENNPIKEEKEGATRQLKHPTRECKEVVGVVNAVGIGQIGFSLESTACRNPPHSFGGTGGLSGKKRDEDEGI